MPNYTVTIIIPCAGNGSRLGLPFPKELAPLGPGRVLIDSCLDLAEKAAENSDIRILLMDDGLRGQTEYYIRDRLPDIPLARVRQGRTAFGMTDGIIGLRPWFSVANVVLLPDAIYESGEDSITRIAKKAMGYGFCFGAVKTEDARNLGALKTSQEHVVLYQDKPHDSSTFDAAWTILGFSRGGAGMDALKQVRASASQGILISDPPVRHAPVVWIDGYRDCGTWESYLAEVPR